MANLQNQLGLSLATSQSKPATQSAGTTTNVQTGQTFQNATSGPYTLANAQANGYTPPTSYNAPTQTIPATQPMSAGILPTPVKATPTNATAGINPITGTPNEQVNSFKPPTQNISTMAPPTVLGGTSAFNAQSQRGLNVAERVALRNSTTPQWIPQTPVQPIKDIPLVGNAMLDKEITNLNYDKNQSVKNTVQAYALAQGDYLKNAGYYTNFKPVNDKFNGVLQDIQSIYAQGGQVTDQQAQLIASRNGVTVEDVKNPANIYNQLQLTEQGKQDLGVTTRENQITDLATKTEQQKQDLQTNLTRNTQQLTKQIDDTQKNLERTEEWFTASGVWSGASRSSGYAKGMQNVKDDANTVISRIQDQIQYANADTTTHLARINDEFTKNTTRLQQSLNSDLQKVNQTMGVQLNGLSDQYGMGSPKLTRALDDIAKNFGSQYMDLYTKYQQQQKNAIALTMDNLNVVDKMNTLNNAMSNKRYNELLANNGAILSGTSLASIANEVKAGTMDMQKYQDIKAIMLNSVMTNLAQTKQVTQDDYNVVAHMLDSGSTPAQIVATLSGHGKTTTTQDQNTGEYVTRDSFGNVVPQTTNVPNIQGTDLVKALSSGTYNGQSLGTGVYATGDAQGNQRASIYNTIQQQGLDSYMARVAPNSKITPDMIRQSASQYGISPEVLATFLQADSGFGTKGLGATNNNPGNVGQFDRYGDQAVKGYATMQEGIDAAAQNLAKRQSALSNVIGGQTNQGNYNPSTETPIILRTQAGNVIKMNATPANALQNVLNSNTDIKVDYNNMFRTPEDQLELYGKGRYPKELIKQGIDPSYAQPYEKQVTWTTQSKHMTGNAVDVLNPTPDVVAKMNKAGFYQPDDEFMRANDPGHFEFKGTTQPGAQIGSGQPQYSDTQKNILSGMDPKTITAIDEKILRQNGLKTSDLYNYKAQPKDTSKLSALAQSAFNSKTITGNPTQQAQQVEELQNAGYLDNGEGNLNYYKAPLSVKQEMPNLISAHEAFDRAKQIIDAHTKSGDLNEMLGSWDAYEERKKNSGLASAIRDTEFGDDFATLDNILGKELSNYMKNISGATVGDREVDRLTKQVPNLDMNETQFKTAMDEYERSLKNANNYMINQYGFSDFDTAKKVILGKQDQGGIKEQPQATAPSSNDPFGIR